MTPPNHWPTIPATEYRERWQKVQGMMAAQELDFLVAYADDLCLRTGPRPLAGQLSLDFGSCEQR